MSKKSQTFSDSGSPEFQDPPGSQSSGEQPREVVVDIQTPDELAEFRRACRKHHPVLGPLVAYNVKSKRWESKRDQNVWFKIHPSAYENPLDKQAPVG